MTLSLDLVSVAASEAFAKRLASCLSPPLVFGLSGEIGTGKTTLIRAVLRCLGVSSTIKSPSFSLLESYELPQLTIHHFDLYRVQQEDELAYFGFRDYFGAQNICFIEWVERAGKPLSWVDVCIDLEVMDEGRHLQLTALSDSGKKIISCLGQP